MKRILASIAAVLFLAVGLSACTEDDSDVVDHNITKAAKNFEINRRVLVVNGITDKYIMVIEGRCNIDPKEGRIWITCKTADDEYKRHQVYTADNVFVTVEQGEPIKASAYHYRVTFKPQTIVPDVDFRGSSDPAELPKNQ